VERVAELGPIAVLKKGQGIGSQMLDWVEAKYEVTKVGVVSCRTDLFPWYRSRGYRTTLHLPLDQSPVALEGAITREGLTYVEMARYNRTKN